MIFSIMILIYLQKLLTYASIFQYVLHTLFFVMFL